MTHGGEDVNQFLHPMKLIDHQMLANAAIPDPPGILMKSSTAWQTWSARCTAPKISLGVNYLQRVMSQPTHDAFKAAMHMIKYLCHNRHQGICFNENGEQTLRVYYDSSNKADYTDGKAQYGYVGMFMGGPIF